MSNENLSHELAEKEQTAWQRGAIAVLVALSIPMLLILATFAANVAYMQMVREQLRVTCDAAAKAALVKYGATAVTVEPQSRSHRPWRT